MAPKMAKLLTKKFELCINNATSHEKQINFTHESANTVLLKKSSYLYLKISKLKVSKNILRSHF